MTELYTLSITEAGDLLRRREISSVELTRAHLERIRAVEDKVKAFTLITDELALQQAEEADRRISQGDMFIMPPDTLHWYKDVAAPFRYIEVPVP